MLSIKASILILWTWVSDPILFEFFASDVVLIEISVEYSDLGKLTTVSSFFKLPLVKIIFPVKLLIKGSIPDLLIVNLVLDKLPVEDTVVVSLLETLISDIVAITTAVTNSVVEAISAQI